MFSDFPASVFAARKPSKPQTRKTPLDLVAELRRLLLHVTPSRDTVGTLEAVDALATELEAAIRQSNGAVYQALADLGNAAAENAKLQTAASVLAWFDDLLPGEVVSVHSETSMYVRKKDARTESIRLVAGTPSSALPALQAMCTDLGDEPPTRDTIPVPDDGRGCQTCAMRLTMTCERCNRSERAVDAEVDRWQA